VGLEVRVGSADICTSRKSRVGDGRAAEKSAERRGRRFGEIHEIDDSGFWH